MLKAESLLLVALVMIAAACGGDDSGDGSGLTVVATTTILGDVAGNVAGDEAGVIVLAPVGADPHDFQASAAQVAEINKADLVIANGLLLEEGMEDVLDAAVDDGVTVMEVAPLLQPLPFGFEADHDHESEDPHVWFDPLRMAEAAGLIAAQLAEIDPTGDWSSRAESYAQDLLSTDADIAETLASIPAQDRRLVTNHESLGYFADRYDFEIVGVVIPGGSTLADPSSRELADLIAVMEQEGVTVIFGETTQQAAVAEAVAVELGEAVEVVSLYTGSVGEPGSGAESLIGMLTTNARRIANALGE